MGFAIAGVVAAGASAYESSQASSAAGAGAKAQQGMSERMYERATGTANLAADRIRALSKATPLELDQQAKGLQAIGSQLESQQRLLNAIDPAIMEASQQALKLLKGDQASSLNPLMQQRQTQRQKLVASLRAQLGPGAETSSMGQQQLQLFDQQTDLMMNQAQQGQIGNLTNVLSGLNSNRPDLAGTAGMGMNIASSLQNRQIGAEQNASSLQLSAITGSAPSLIDTAGAQYVGPQLQARGYQQLFNSVGTLAAQQYGKESTPKQTDMASAMDAGASGGNYQSNAPTRRNF